MAEYNTQLVQDSISDAQQKANQSYSESKARNETETLAQAKAAQAWKETMDKAGLTGMYEGQYTMPSQQYFANTFGTWGTPTAGQQTLAGQQQQFGQGATLASMYGQYYAPGQAPTAGQQTQAAQQQAFAQGLQTQQEQRAAQQQQQSQAQQYLSLLASLRGPADWAKYQQVLGSTPGGMRDLVAAAMGQYVPGGGATTGMQPQAVSLQSMMGQVSGQPYYGQGGGQLNMPNVYGQNSQGMYQQQPQNAQWQGQQPNAGWGNELQGQQVSFGANGQPQYGAPQQRTGGLAPQQFGYQAPAAGQANPQGAYQVGGQNRLDVMPGTGQAFDINQQGGLTPAQQQQRNAQGNGTNTMGAPDNQMNLPAPNQIAAQSWNNMAPSQQQMLLGQYESQGWDKGDVTALMNQSLPKYAANAPGAGTWRLR